jgi:hypothetical protein
MLGVSKGAVNETALGDAPRRHVRHHSARAQNDRALGQAGRQRWVAQRDQDSVAGLTTLGDPCAETGRLIIAHVDQVDERLIGGARLVEGRAAVVQPRPYKRRSTIGFSKPRDDADVGRHQTRGAEEQRGLSRSARSRKRHGFSLGDREIDVGESVRARQARPTPSDESLGDPGDFERHSHADR